jgi:hypothetical protein
MDTGIWNTGIFTFAAMLVSTLLITIGLYYRAAIIIFSCRLLMWN